MKRPKEPIKPQEPYKPSPPAETIHDQFKVLKNIEASNYCDMSLTAFLAQFHVPEVDASQITVSVSYDDQGCDLVLGTYSEAPNPYYKEQLADYKRRLAYYNKAYPAYKAKLPEYKAKMEVYKKELAEYNIWEQKRFIERMEKRLEKMKKEVA